MLRAIDKQRPSLSCLFSESPKFAHFLSKVSEIVLKLKDDDVLSEVLDTLSALRKPSTKQRTSLIDKTLAWLLTEYSNNSINGYQELFEDVLASVVRDADLVNRHEYYRRYLRMLYDANKLTVLLTEAQEMYAQFPQNAHSLGKPFINNPTRISCDALNTRFRRAM